jgi:hypothetical protein
MIYRGFAASFTRGCERRVHQHAVVSAAASCRRDKFEQGASMLHAAHWCGHVHVMLNKELVRARVGHMRVSTVNRVDFQ